MLKIFKRKPMPVILNDYTVVGYFVETHMTFVIHVDAVDVKAAMKKTCENLKADINVCEIFDLHITGNLWGDKHRINYKVG